MKKPRCPQNGSCLPKKEFLEILWWVSIPRCFPELASTVPQYCSGLGHTNPGALNKLFLQSSQLSGAPWIHHFFTLTPFSHFAFLSVARAQTHVRQWREHLCDDWLIQILIANICVQQFPSLCGVFKLTDLMFRISDITHLDNIYCALFNCPL